MIAPIKKIVSLSIVGGFVLALSTQAFASSDSSKVQTGSQAQTQTTVQAMDNPNSIIYPFKCFFENLRIELAFNQVQKAKLLASLAEERKAELQNLVNEHNNDELSDGKFNQTVHAVADDYKNKVNEATDTLVNLPSANSSSNKDQIDSVSAINQTVSNATDISTSGMGVDQSAVNNVSDVQAAHAVVANGYDESEVQALRNKGYGYGKIAHLFALAKASGKTVNEIDALLSQDKGFGKVAKDLGLSPKVIGAGKHIQAVKMANHGQAEIRHEKLKKGHSKGHTLSTSGVTKRRAQDPKAKGWENHPRKNNWQNKGYEKGRN